MTDTQTDTTETGEGVTIPLEVRWRGSVYQLVNTEDGKVNWVNPVSRHRASCSTDAWLRADPYDAYHR